MHYIMHNPAAPQCVRVACLSFLETFGKRLTYVQSCVRAKTDSALSSASLHSTRAEVRPSCEWSSTGRLHEPVEHVPH